MEIKVHIPNVHIELNPQKMEDSFSMMITSQLHRGLLRYNPTGDIVADLAESWTESNDRLTYRFKIKKSTFSDGRPITSKDVQMSFAKIFYNSAGIAADIDYIVGAKNFSKHGNLRKLGVQVLNEREVEFKLERPSALFLKQIAVVDCSILPIANFKETLEIKNNGPFSGPYKLIFFDGSKYILEKWRNDTFDSKLPPTKIVFFKTDENPIELAKTGLTDTLDRDPVSKTDVEYFKRKGWGVIPTELTGETFLILNPKLLDLTLRQFLFKKIDVIELVKTIDDEKLSPAFGLIPFGFRSELNKEDHMELKRNLKDYSGKKVSIPIDYDPSSKIEAQTMKYLKTIWNSNHIEVVPQPMDKAKKLYRMFNNKSIAVLGRKGIDYPDGFSVLSYFKSKYKSNYFFVNNISIDEQISMAVSEFDESVRTEKYKKIQKDILKEYTVIPLFFGSQASGLWSNNIKNAPSHPLGYHTMPYESIEMRRN